MEILNINALNYDKKFIDPLLKKGLSDDYLFDRVFIELSIKKTTADIVNWFYRLLWESCYIKSTMPSNIHQPKNGELNIIISLSEAIAFIKAATPPIMQSRIPTAIVSVDEIIKTLITFLCEDNRGEEQHYIDIFKNTIRFKVFDTVEPSDLKKMESLSPSSDGYTVMIQMTSESFQQVLKPGKKTLLCIFKSHGPNDLPNIVRDICGENIHITNVTINGMTIHIKVAFTDGMVSSSLANNIAMSYRNFL